MIKNLSIFILLLLFFSCGNKIVKDEQLPISFIEDSVLISSYFALAMSEKDNADSFVNLSNTLSKKNDALKYIHDYGLAKHLVQTGKFKEAQELSEHVIQVLSKDSTNIWMAKHYNILGSIAAYQNNQDVSVNNFKNALQIFERLNELQQVAIINFNLANVFLSRLEYETAYQYSTNAYDILAQLKDTAYLPICKALIAITAIQVNEIEKAEKFSKEALEMSEKYKNIQGIILVHYAIGELAAHHEQYNAAIESLNIAAQLSEQYRLFQIMLTTKAALLSNYLQIENYEKALENGIEALELLKVLNNEEIKYNIYKNISTSYAGIGKHEEAYHYMKESGVQYREKSNIQNQKIIQELLINYETEKKNNTILEQENQLSKNKVWLFIIAFVLVIVTMVLIFYQRITVQKNRAFLQKKEREILEAIQDGEEKERKRLASELHDGVAANLTVARLNLEAHQPNTEPNKKVLELIKKLHKEIRNVAHNLMPIDFNKVSLITAIENFCKDSNTATMSLNFSSNCDEIKLANNNAHILYRCTQEVIQNALKYSETSKIEVRIFIQNGVGTINVEDNGIGFEVKEHGHSGINNIIERLSKIDASYEIDTAVGKGTSVYLSFKMN